ncbi:hypothetical protein BDZ94DRAFT_1311941 [Collybia nuda]|uniref:Uncharacterized protein n=1 Tax=Collybia nuda TaxID=64659 RepID=A0A9P5Y0C3_9AGAR|nr:hypothetical protein BDZ94DRAFT_1311941 [Collybia nuda]
MIAPSPLYLHDAHCYPPGGKSALVDTPGEQEWLSNRRVPPLNIHLMQHAAHFVPDSTNKSGVPAEAPPHTPATPPKNLRNRLNSLTASRSTDTHHQLDLINFDKEDHPFVACPDETGPSITASTSTSTNNEGRPLATLESFAANRKMNDNAPIIFSKHTHSTNTTKAVMLEGPVPSGQVPISREIDTTPVSSAQEDIQTLQDYEDALVLCTRALSLLARSVMSPEEIKIRTTIHRLQLNNNSLQKEVDHLSRLAELLSIACEETEADKNTLYLDRQVIQPLYDAIRRCDELRSVRTVLIPLIYPGGEMTSEVSVAQKASLACASVTWMSNV